MTSARHMRGCTARKLGKVESRKEAPASAQDAAVKFLEASRLKAARNRQMRIFLETIAGTFLELSERLRGIYGSPSFVYGHLPLHLQIVAESFVGMADELLVPEPRSPIRVDPALEPPSKLPGTGQDDLAQKLVAQFGAILDLLIPIADDGSRPGRQAHARKAVEFVLSAKATAVLMVLGENGNV